MPNQAWLVLPIAGGATPPFTHGKGDRNGARRRQDELVSSRSLTQFLLEHAVQIVVPIEIKMRFTLVAMAASPAIQPNAIRPTPSRIRSCPGLRCDRARTLRHHSSSGEFCILIPALDAIGRGSARVGTRLHTSMDQLNASRPDTDDGGPWTLVPWVRKGADSMQRRKPHLVRGWDFCSARVCRPQ